MRRLNVRWAQIEECIQQSMFAISSRPQSPELQLGEPLLLQLVKTEAAKLGKLHSRIDFALVFDHLEPDHDGTMSRLHWPKENRTWPWIVYSSATVPTVPFSLEDLDLSMDYDGQTNPRYIEPRDERLIRPYIQWSLAEVPKPTLQLIPASRVAQEFGPQRTLSAIYNHDRIAILHPVQKRTVNVEEFMRNQYLADSLKSYYENCCQVCGQDFLPEYGVAFSETHHIRYLSLGGPDVSGNIVVLCPNHHRIVHATDARFNRQSLAYEYPNGLREPLIRPDHFVNAPPIWAP
jgi:5-methylcytosine-specific restriction endonuclease McrA